MCRALFWKINLEVLTLRELIRGANIPLTKEMPNLKNLTIGIKWSSTDKILENDIQLGAILCNSNNKIISDENLIYFNQLSNNNSTIEMGDDRKQLNITITDIPEPVEIIDVVVWINTSTNRTLSQLSDLTIRLLDGDSGTNIINTENFAKFLQSERALCLVQLYRYKGDWKVKSKGDGWHDGLNGLLSHYGVVQ